MEESKEEQRDVFRFLVAEGAGTCEIHRCMSAVYGKHCVSLTSVHEWQKRFHEGHTSLQDDSHPGQAYRAVMPDVIARIDDLIRENRRITEEQIRIQVGISHGSVHAIIKDHLQFGKICAQWVLHQLTEGQMIDKMAACHLQRYHKEKYVSVTYCHRG